MSKIKLIVFDWDDVFTLGSSEGYYACYKAAVDATGAKVDNKTLREKVTLLWGRPHKNVIKSILVDTPNLVEKANEYYEENLFSEIFLNKLKIVEGSFGMLQRLKEKYTLAIASGVNPRLLKENIFSKFNVPDVFKQIITSYDLEDKSKGKPYPDMLVHIMENLNFLPEETIMVGDAPGDVKMAKSANVMPVVVLTGQLTSEEAKQLEVKYIIEDVSELESMLKKL